MSTRLLAFTLALLTLSAAPAAAAPDGPVFTVAGGGSRRPAPGVVATHARLRLLDAGALADGGALVLTIDDGVDPYHLRQPLWRLDATGVLRAVPGVRDATAIAATPDGTEAWAVPQPRRGFSGGTRVLRLDPAGVAVPQPVADLGDQLEGIADLVGLDDGSVLATDGDKTFRVASDGTVSAAAPGGATLEATLPQPGGAFLRVGVHGRIQRFGADGLRSTLPLQLRSTFPYAATSDGMVVTGQASSPARGLLAGVDDGRSTVLAVDPAGVTPPRVVVGPRSGLGDGDGGPPATARVAVHGAATTPAGGLLLVDTGQGPGAPVEYLQSAALRPDDRLRLLTPRAGVPAATAAFAAGLYTGWPAGRVPVLTGGPGRVRLTIGRPGAAPRVVSATVAGGADELRLPARPARGPADLTLEFTGTDGSRVRARAHVDTTRRLALRRARRTVGSRVFGLGDGDEGAGSSYRAGRCSRRSGSVVSCRVIERLYDEDGHSDSCVERQVVRLRLDGLHLAVGGRC